ncbi:ABC transporter permease [Oceanibacterium hippocampi]|uniref:Putative aliphatic sulfonates transport permease protein SsuC n=1 Tax=Oceanibacterium hippocampi TaxID=745714 RepID=A0A1Y5SMW2_9PROT|nr:ABC transporter permease [Oceanibacterium hippocampi]SLN43245.1 Putative aliphatic sulfonates transport permease protein SsuC [Oceanibacterium hippocampi]
MAVTEEAGATHAAGKSERSLRLAAWRRRSPPVLAAIAILLAWQLGVMLFGVPAYIAPTPLDVLGEFGREYKLLFDNLVPTALESLAGFFVGNLVAVLIAISFVHNKTAERAFYPLAVFVNTIPILAIAPILVLIFGNGFAPKVMIAALICFFPTLVNMVRGLESVSPQMLDLMRILSASKSEVFWKIRIQSSLPFLFAALKIATTTCVIGAIVGEWIGSNFGLGALILEATYNFRSPLLYATVFVASGLAVVLFASVTAIEKRLIRWKPPTAH